MDSCRFYADLSVITRFFDVTDASVFHDAPADWSIIVADIVGSTKAVASGKYKTVNMIGAACITAAISVCDETTIAYVFGGDGATLLAPPDVLDDICAALCALQNRSLDVFGLELRVGAVPVKEILERGQQVRVARLELSPNNHLAMFAGGGFMLADDLVKSAKTGDQFAIGSPDPNKDLDLSRLSCRWEPLASKKGSMIALLVAARGLSGKTRDANFSLALQRISAAIGTLPAHAPANDSTLTFNWPPRDRALEAKIRDGKVQHKTQKSILFQSAFQWLAHMFGLKFGDYDAREYKREIMQNTDYQRFDDMIRLVLDCSPHTILVLREVLGELENRKLIHYGMHMAKNALMTCVVFDLGDSRHIHFIDADEGGFTLAARQLKAKLKAAATA